MKSKFLSLLFLLVCFLVNTSVNAQQVSFIGWVRDSLTGQPIEGATVYIADLKQGGFTDNNGKFKFSNLSVGQHLIEISRLGYGAMARYTRVGGTDSVIYRLTETIVENEAVVVTGVSRAAQLRTVPFQVALIRRQDLLKSTSTNLIESITRKAGVSSLTTGPAISKPFIRGLGYNRVLVMNDGVRQEGQQWGDEHGIEIDDASVQKIEVLKGPATLIYGSDALAGVINVISHVPAPENTFNTAAQAEYQTNNKLRSANITLSGNRKGFSWDAYGNYKAAADYKNKYDGSVFNSKFVNQNWGGYAGYNGSWGFSHLIISQYNLQAGLVEGERDSSGQFTLEGAGGGIVPATHADFSAIRARIPFQKIQHTKWISDNKFKIGQNQLAVNLGWQNNRRQEFANPDDVKEAELYFKLHTFTYNVQYQLAERKGWKNTIGVNGMHQTNFNAGAEQLIPDYKLLDAGVFIYTTKQKDKVNFSGGIRWDNRNVQTSSLLDGAAIKRDAFEKSFSSISASAGITYAPSKSILYKFNIARAFRSPGIAELSSNGAHEGTIRYEYGNTQLKNEISWQADAGFEFTQDHLSFTIAGFVNHFNNFIFYRKLTNQNGTDSLVEENGDWLTAFTFDQSAATLYGGEITLDLHPHPLDWLHIENSFSWVRGQFNKAIDGSRNLPFIPAPKLQTEFRGDFKKIGKHLTNVYAKIELENFFSQNNPFTGFNTETATAGYSLIHAGWGATLVNKDRDLFQFFLTANNIFDKAYQNHLSRLKYAAENLQTERMGVFNMGRNFCVKILLPLQRKWK